MNAKVPPDYFKEIYELTLKRWKQLESDPELAAPWRQLFSQVQSPRHVLSELLQNADDVGAVNVNALINGSTFYFQHDGKDFTKEEFASLCRFGYSNKRKLHTIGFRGIGFKSTFSLGDPVNVLTPSLAVSYYKKRFTLPVWHENGTLTNNTEICVAIQDKNRQNELEKNLEEWKENPASLIFFNNIKKLKIGDISIHKEEIVTGPVDGSEKIKLSGHNEIEILICRSNLEQFPDEAIHEILQERNTEEVDVPPCQVELVLGLRKNQKLYVVLPTGVNLNLPFSCNAPFLQDPSRIGIKSPSLSPTNRWLLKRIGKLGAVKMMEWLNNRSLEIAERAKAYELLPTKANENDSLDSTVSKIICDAFYNTIKNQPILLTSSGDLVSPNQCYIPPYEVYGIWSPHQILEAFGQGKKYLLSNEVNKRFRKHLLSWGFIVESDMESLLKLPAMKMKRNIPKPQHFENLLSLWLIVQKIFPYDYYVDRKRLSIIPVKDDNYLISADSVVRMPNRKDHISVKAWKFLLDQVIIADPEWFKYIDELEKRIEKGETDFRPVIQLLKDIGMYYPSDANTIMKNASIHLFSRKEVLGTDCVLMAHLASALDAKTPEEFKFYGKDRYLRTKDFKIISLQDSIIEDITPQDWANSHLLNSEYFDNYEACSGFQWKEWITLEKSGLWPFIPIQEKTEVVWSKDFLKKFLKSRNVSAPNYYPYVTAKFEIRDFDFADELLTHWEKLSNSDELLWARITQRVILAPKWYWEKHIEATIFQYATTGNMATVKTEFILAKWIVRLKEFPCLFDTNGKARMPAELFMRNPETEPFFGIEPFVKSELDNEVSKPLLRLLGVREKQADTSKVIDRLRSLSGLEMNERLLQEVLKWYGVLEKITFHADEKTMDQITSVFNNEELIYTSESKWERSSNVFISNSEDYPEAPTVHPSTIEYSLWIRIGVENHPTEELIIAWLTKLPVNVTFDQNTKNRIAAALKRFPEKIWNTCKHWLAINNTWQQVESLKYRLTMQSLTKYADLFIHIKSRCADFQMLKYEQIESLSFAILPDLSAKIEYRLTKEPESFINEPQSPIWLSTIGKCLKRVKINNEDHKQVVIENAKRLESSFWKTFYKNDFIEVTPYIDNIPAGIAQKRNFIWHDYHIFIREGSIAKSIHDIVEELARPFANSIGLDLIKSTFFACIDRSEEYIKDYMSEYFTLEDEPIMSGKFSLETYSKDASNKIFPEENETEDNAPSLISEIVDAEPFFGQLTDSEDDETASDKSEHHEETGKNLLEKNKVLPLFDRYAYSKGFKWNLEKRRFENHDKEWIEKSQAPLHWQLKTPFPKRYYWVHSQCLSQSGIEIPTEVWSFIEYNSHIISLILLDELGNPLELKGESIISKKMSKKIEIFPSKYIIRLNEK